MEAKDTEISQYIENVKQSVGEDPQCFLMSVLLAHKFDGEMFYNSNHFMTKIGDKFYDKNLSVENIPEDFISFKENYSLENEMSAMSAIFHKQTDRLNNAIREHIESLESERSQLEKDSEYLRRTGNMHRYLNMKSKLSLVEKKIQRLKKDFD